MRSVLIAMLLGLGCFAARPDIFPVPEDQQAALALKIIDAYHNPRPATPPRQLRILYFTPSDRVPAPQYQQRLAAIIEDIHEFYRDGMERLGFGSKSFAMERDASGKLFIRLVKASEPDSSFTDWPGKPGTGSAEGGKMVKDDCLSVLKAAHIGFDSETFLIFCNLANWDEQAQTFRHHSPYYGEYSGNSGLCFAADSEILNLDNLPKKQPIIHDEEYGDMSLGKFETIFIGGVAHELGHAFTLPHCGERWDERPLGVSIMGVGNHTYRDERRGDGKRAFLTMASAMRLASHPLFNGSDKGWGKDTKLTHCDLLLSTNVTLPALAGRPAALRVEGTAKGSPPIYGVVAYFDSVHDGGYSAPTGTSVPDAQGRFAIEISDLAQCGDGEIRVEFCHANGAMSERRLGFAVTPEGSVDLSQWQTRQALQPLAVAVENGRLADAQRALAEIRKSENPKFEKAIAMTLVDTMRVKTKLSPAAVPPGVATVLLADTQPRESVVGWLTPAANRIPTNPQIDSPLLDCGTLFATGFFAHSPSRYVFDLGGKWKNLRGKGGLHTAMQAYAYGVIFTIKADGKEIYRSPTIRGPKKAEYDLDITGVKTLELIVDKAAERNGGNWALWLDPQLSR
ncbi:MAG TPA: NPCBM/NEW2 domain-containing protein [Verrucomicrobiae bacterium]|nr:NPCBM/NEW2 domain-containing protein [Verrucomicrobiae bacterium]